MDKKKPLSSALLFVCVVCSRLGGRVQDRVTSEFFLRGGQPRRREHKMADESPSLPAVQSSLSAVASCPEYVPDPWGLTDRFPGAG